MLMTRRDLEILLDTPDRKDYLVSAYADLRVRDGFRHYAEIEMQNLARAAGNALSEAEARKVLDANMEAIFHAVDQPDPMARGLAVFSGAERELFHAVPLDFPVENYLVLDEEPYVLPLLERWYGEPNFLIVVADTRQFQLFEAHAGVAEPIRAIQRDTDEEFQRDKPRFTYKKRFAKVRHEFLHGLEEDGFLKEAIDEVAGHWDSGNFAGLILLGQPPILGAIRQLLPKDLEAAVVEEAPQTMTDRPEDVTDDVARALERWRDSEKTRLLGELNERWKEDHLVANGPTAVLDALQQGRATEVILGPRHDITGARCSACGYRFGAPLRTCVYCQSPCKTVNAAQEILRMALRQRVGVHLFEQDGDPATQLDRASGVAALLRAGANWAPEASNPSVSAGKS